MVTLTRMPSANPITAPTPIAAPVLIARSMAQAQEGRPGKAGGPKRVRRLDVRAEGPRPQGATSGSRRPHRSPPQGSNVSKPYQAQLIRRQGFAIPETLVTNEPELVHEFVSRHGRVVYKSISGTRSIVQTLASSDLSRLEQIRWCPVQFQAYVPGTDARVHVIGDEVFATAIHSDATDYRYAAREELDTVRLAAIELADELAERCVTLARVLQLPFAGIDLRLGPDGEATCFEVNPSPAFTFYELSTGQPIARALARYLLGG